MDLNQVSIIGRLTRDAENRATGSGLYVCNFSIAVNRRKKNGDQWEDEANFFDVTLFGKQAENLHRHLVKGKRVAISGELRQERWQQDGQNRSKVGIIADNVQLLDGGNKNESGTTGAYKYEYSDGASW